MSEETEKKIINIIVEIKAVLDDFMRKLVAVEVRLKKVEDKIS